MLRRIVDSRTATLAGVIVALVYVLREIRAARQTVDDVSRAIADADQRVAGERIRAVS